MKRKQRKKINISEKKQQAGDSQRKKLYEALLSIYSFYHLKDLLFLKSDHFLTLCEVSYIDWNFKKDWLKKSAPKNDPKKNWPFRFSCPLTDYGELIFFSRSKFSQRKKSFLKKITSAIAVTLHFIETKEKMENIKQQWGWTFNSFSQAFCITDKNFKIIRANRSFHKMSQTAKTDLHNKSLADIFPISATMLKQTETEGSWLARGEKGGQKSVWEISFKPLFLKKEKIQALLFLIKDVTEEMDIEEKLSAQAKEREIGLIKGSIAHELNNPIAGIKTLLTVIERQISPRKMSIRGSLREMQKAINRCRQIVEHLLFVSQHSGNRQARLSPIRKHFK